MKRILCLANVCDIPLKGSKYTSIFCTKTIRFCYVVVFTNVNELYREKTFDGSYRTFSD